MVHRYLNRERIHLGRKAVNGSQSEMDCGRIVRHFNGGIENENIAVFVTNTLTRYFDSNEIL